jgi:hypothetical protein
MIKTALAILFGTLAVQPAGVAPQPLPCMHGELQQLGFSRVPGPSLPAGWDRVGPWARPRQNRVLARARRLPGGGALPGTMNSAPVASLTLFAYNAVQNLS